MDYCQQIKFCYLSHYPIIRKKQRRLVKSDQLRINFMFICSIHTILSSILDVSTKLIIYFRNYFLLHIRFVYQISLNFFESLWKSQQSHRFV